MKIAVLSDIHANLPALESVLKDIENQNPDMVYCLGDLVGYAPWPNAVIEEIRRKKISTVSGYDDRAFDDTSNDLYIDKSDFTRVTLKSENREYLKTLPDYIQLLFNTETREKINIRFSHSNLEKNGHPTVEKYPNKYLNSLLERLEIDILITGYTHIPSHKIVSPKNSREKPRHIINPGSVGKPKDGDPRACYAIITFANKSFNSLKVDFIRVEYDIERAARAIEEASIPKEYAESLRRAG